MKHAMARRQKKERKRAMINYERITLEELKNPERFTDNTDFLKDAVAYAVGKTTEIRGEYVHNYPTANSENFDEIAENMIDFEF